MFGIMRNGQDIEMLRQGVMPQGVRAVEVLRAQLAARLDDDDRDDADKDKCRDTLSYLVENPIAAAKELCPFEPDVAAKMIETLTPMAAANRSAAALLAVELLQSRYGIVVKVDYIKNLYKRNYPDGQIRTPGQWAEFKRKEKNIEYLPKLVSTFF